jgi:HPt (histidine-containing phosphotransfer) domain-containing protein
MRSEPDADMQTMPMRSLVVGSDRVACTLAARLIERLGHPAPLRVSSVEDAVALGEGFDVALVDDSALHGKHAVASWPQLAGRLIVMSAANAEVAGIPAQAVLRKPLTLEALASALLGLRSPEGDDDFDTALWSELLRLFGRSGLAEMIAALRLDLSRQQQQFERARQQRDGAALRGIAHALRGAAQQLGAVRLASLCTEVESGAAAGIGADNAERGARMLSRYGALVSRLQRELEQS